MADIAAGPAIDRIQWRNIADLWDSLPAVKNWVARVTSRPAYQKAAPPDEFRVPARVV
jgi:glutathione S-transferase